MPVDRLKASNLFKLISGSVSDRNRQKSKSADETDSGEGPTFSNNNAPGQVQSDSGGIPDNPLGGGNDFVGAKINNFQGDAGGTLNRTPGQSLNFNSSDPNVGIDKTGGGAPIGNFQPFAGGTIDRGGLSRPSGTPGLQQGPAAPSGQFLGSNPFAGGGTVVVTERNDSYNYNFNLNQLAGGGILASSQITELPVLSNTYGVAESGGGSSEPIYPGDYVTDWTSWFAAEKINNVTYQMTGVVNGSWLNISGGARTYIYSSGTTPNGPENTLDPYDNQPTWYLSKSNWTGPYIGELFGKDWLVSATASFHVFLIASIESAPIYPQFGGDTNNHRIWSYQNTVGINYVTSTLHPGQAFVRFQFNNGTLKQVGFDVQLNKMLLFEWWGDGTNMYARIGTSEVRSSSVGTSGIGIVPPQIDSSPTTHYVGYVSELMTMDISQSSNTVSQLRENYFFNLWPSTNANPSP